MWSAVMKEEGRPLLYDGPNSNDVQRTIDLEYILPPRFPSRRFRARAPLLPVLVAAALSVECADRRRRWRRGMPHRRRPSTMAAPLPSEPAADAPLLLAAPMGVVPVLSTVGAVPRQGRHQVPPIRRSGTRTDRLAVPMRAAGGWGGLRPRPSPRVFVLGEDVPPLALWGKGRALFGKVRRRPLAASWPRRSWFCCRRCRRAR